VHLSTACWLDVSFLSTIRLFVLFFPYFFLKKVKLNPGNPNWKTTFCPIKGTMTLFSCLHHTSITEAPVHRFATCHPREKTKDGAKKAKQNSSDDPLKNHSDLADVFRTMSLLREQDTMTNRCS
jgi:hypothetical protein